MCVHVCVYACVCVRVCVCVSIVVSLRDIRHHTVCDESVAVTVTGVCVHVCACVYVCKCVRVCICVYGFMCSCIVCVRVSIIVT